MVKGKVSVALLSAGIAARELIPVPRRPLPLFFLSLFFFFVLPLYSSAPFFPLARVVDTNVQNLHIIHTYKITLRNTNKLQK